MTQDRTPPGSDAGHPRAETRAALVPGGAIVTDASGTVRLSLRDEALDSLPGSESDLIRLAYAHYAAMHLAGDEAPPAPDQPRAIDAVDAGAAGGGGDVPDDLILAPVPSYLQDGLEEAVIELTESSQQVLPIVPWRGRFAVGPLVGGADGHCISCLIRSVGPNWQEEELLGSKKPPRITPALESACATFALLPYAGDHVVEVSLDGTLGGIHRVRRFPDCAGCGCAEQAGEGAPPRLVSQHDAGLASTGSRRSSPEVVTKRYEHLVSPLTGAVRSLEPVDLGAPGLLHVWTAGHATAMHLSDLAGFTRDRQHHSGGKGCTAAEAKASALCEGLERFSSVFHGDEIDVVAPMRELETALHPNACALFSHTQLHGDARDEPTAIAARAPAPFDPEAEVAWSRLYDLTSGAEAHLPTAYTYFGFRGKGAEFCHADSNGVAAGETIEEAILQALLELIERDAVGIWWYNRLRRPSVHVASFGDDRLLTMFEHYDRVGRDVWVLDVTSDLGVPTFAAVSTRQRGKPEAIFGFGAHFDPAVALRRAVTEMNQLFAIVRQPLGDRVAQLRGGHEAAIDWWDSDSLEAHAYLVPSEAALPRRRSDWSQRASGDILRDVERCVGVLNERGISVYVREMTRADIGLPVVRVVAPGLRHFWRRSAPGRLYEVPIAMGLRGAPLSEEELNPVSLFV